MNEGVFACLSNVYFKTYWLCRVSLKLLSAGWVSPSHTCDWAELGTDVSEVFSFPVLPL